MSDTLLTPVVTPLAPAKINWPLVVLAVALLVVATYLIFFRRWRLSLRKGPILSPARKIQAQN